MTGKKTGNSSQTKLVVAAVLLLAAGGAALIYKANSYPAALAKYQEEQNIGRQIATPVVASPEKNPDDLAKAYPFLQQDVAKIKDIQQKVTTAQQTMPVAQPALPQAVPPQSPDNDAHIQVAENIDKKSGINIFFVGKSGRLWCGSHGCIMDVYVDTGEGYHKAGSLLVAKDMYVSRVDGQVLLFAGAPGDPNTVEWILKDGMFVENLAPKPPQ